MPGPNRHRKFKNRHGSSCAMCKPYKNGGAPARSDREILEAEEAGKEMSMVEGWQERVVRLRNAPERPDRFRAGKKPKPKKGKAWRVETRWSDRPEPTPDAPESARLVWRLSSEWRGRRYRDEKGARQAFDHFKNERAWTSDRHARLLDPDGSVVEEHVLKARVV